MRSSDGVMFIENMTSQLLETIADLMANLVVSHRNADVPSAIRKMITDSRAVASGAIYDVHKGGNSIGLGSPRMIGDPLIHLSDMGRRMVGAKKLLPVPKPAVGHELGLSLHSPPPPGDADVGVGKFPLHGGNKTIYVVRARVGWLGMCGGRHSIVWMWPVGVRLMDRLGWNVVHLSAPSGTGRYPREGCWQLTAERPRFYNFSMGVIRQNSGRLASLL
jgi:hypothetical protein